LRHSSRRISGGIPILPLLAAVVLAALLLLSTLTGCGQEDLAELSPDIRAIAENYGPAEALAQAKERVEQEPTAEAYERLAQAYTLTRDLEEMVKALEKALELDPNWPRAVIGMAVVRMRQGKPAEAQKLTERLLDEDFRGPREAQVTRARALLAQNQRQQAYDMLPTAIKQHPGHAPLHYALGDSALSLAKLGEAEAAYRAAIKLVPGERRYRQALITALVRSRKMEQAVEAAKQAQEASPENAMVHFTAGSLYSQMGDIEAAIAAYEEALLLRPDLAPAANNLAITLADRGEQLSRATDLATKVLRQDPKNHAYADTLAWTWVRSGKYAEGIKLLEQVRTHWPDSPAVKYHLGYALAKSGKTQRAKTLLKQAAEAENRPDVAKQAQAALAEL